jgi:hypothetical protein
MKNFLRYLKESGMDISEDVSRETSDEVMNADGYMYSNSDSMSYYSRGNGFEIEDNIDFYEVVKIVKDLTDKHIFLKNLVWKVDIGGGEALFTFELDGEDSSEEVHDFFYESMNQFLVSNILLKFGDFFEFDSRIKRDSVRSVFEFEVKKKKGETELIIRQIRPIL